MVKTDCFAFRHEMGKSYCNALTELNCDKCHFYKKKGTECNTCPHKGTHDCKKVKGERCR